MQSDPKIKQSPGYLVATTVEQLVEDGIQFEGTTERDRTINMIDFTRTREIIQRFGPNLTPDQQETLLRFLKCCIKSD